MYMNFNLNNLDRQKILMIAGLAILLLMFYCRKKSKIENFAGTCQTNYNNVYAPNLNTNIIECCNSSSSVGFNEIFEVMKDPNAPGRLGRDGLNEHVHNHLFTIIGRMGIIGLISYLFCF